MSKSTTTSQAVLTPEQRAQIAAQTEFFTKTIAPTYKGAVLGATDIYNRAAGGVANAAQNQAEMAYQAQQALGGTGESALRTGIAGLQSLFDPNYERNQVMAALAPAQAQYQQNLEMQGRGFGGSGNLGSARQALADRALAGSTQAAQMQTAANLQSQIAQQRAAVAGQLASLGQGGIGQAVANAGLATQAAMLPQDFYNKYASIIFGTPSASYNPDFSGTQGRVANELKVGFGINTPMGKIGG